MSIHYALFCYSVLHRGNHHILLHHVLICIFKFFFLLECSSMKGSIWRENSFESLMYSQSLTCLHIPGIKQIFFLLNELMKNYSIKIKYPKFSFISLSFPSLTGVYMNNRSRYGITKIKLY